MPKWLGPWLFPIILVVAVLGGVAESGAGPVMFAVIWVLLVGGLVGLLVWLRLRQLKENPPNPELRHKPFWRF
ncbi:MAG TPA: hypothetical protein VG405_03205 [Solirubrobacteraceae bacterium]|jgi:hypothetical protein|nr:hypothetical protein [Solirubrobacteraceae bacterium]